MAKGRLTVKYGKGRQVLSIVALLITLLLPTIGLPASVYDKIVNAPGTGFSQVSSGWTIYNNSYLYNGNDFATATFSTTIDKTGEYKIIQWVPCGSLTRNDQAGYQINGSGLWYNVSQRGSSCNNDVEIVQTCLEVGQTTVALNGGNVSYNEYTFADQIKFLWQGETASCTGVPPSHTILASAVGGGTITPAGSVVVASGADQNFTFTPDVNHAVQDVTVDGGSEGVLDSYTFNDVSASHTIVVTFSDTVYTIVASVAGGGGTITPAGTNVVAAGTPKTFEFKADNGYIVSKVVIDGVELEDPTALSSYTFFEIGANHTIEVSFAAGFVVTPTFTAGGVINPGTPQSVLSGEGVSFLVQADVCYVVDDVTVDTVTQGAIDNYTYTNVVSNSTIHADFSLSTAPITISSVSGVHASISPSGNATVTCNGSKTYTVTYDGTVDDLYVSVNQVSYKVLAGGVPVAVDNVVHDASHDTFTITINNITEETVVKLKEVFEMADYPLDIVTRAAPPNIMFVLDDSGSMDWEFMTTEDSGTFSFQYYVFKTDDIVYRTYYNAPDRYLTTDQKSMWKSQWSGYNKMYYNPASTYVPWPNVVADNLSTSPRMRSHPTENNSPYIDADGVYVTMSSVPIPNTHYYVESGSDVYLVVIDYDNSSIKYYKVTGTSGSGATQKVTALTLVATPPSDVASKRTYATEIQNFANWFTFYRKRELAATSAIAAVIDQVSNAYVGIRSINSDGTYGVRKEVTPVRVLYLGSNNEFVYKNEVDTLLNSLYALKIAAYGTPLRKGLQSVGYYFDQTDSNTGGLTGNPWFSKELGGECQQSFDVVMTDGYYNGDSPGVNNVDSGMPAPYGDTYWNTLADVGMRYYDTDLVADTTLADKVPGENNRQHLQTYTVAFGVKGTLSDDDYTLVPGCTGADCNYPVWPNPGNGNSEKIDDLFHAAVNGRGLYLNASDPKELVDSLLDVIVDIADQNGSSASVSVNGDELYADPGDGVTRMYQTQYVSPDWIGKIYAYPISTDGSVDTAQPLWEAGAKLNTALQNGASVSSRIIATLKNDADPNGVAFDTISNLTTTQQAYFDDGMTGTSNQDLLEFIRGSNAKESSTLYRKRTGRLGDIVNSGALYVDGYLYVGANDGMLHAFNATDGEEKFAYLPAITMPNLKNLVSQSYGDSHKFFVDNTPYAEKMGGTTYLIGGLGRGGNGYYALDISSQTSITSAATLASRVLWEYPQENTPVTDGLDDLGNSYSRAYILKSNASGTTAINSSIADIGGYVAFFGNGYGSPNGNAVLYFLNPKTGVLIKKIDVGGTAQNGLGSPVAMDVNNDNKMDYIYAGDLEGNMWKFDVTSSDPAEWQVAYCDDGNDADSCKNSISPQPLMKGKPNQAITSTPDIIRHYNKEGYMVVFGTGRFLSSDDWQTTTTQSLYGIWDWGDDGDDLEYLGQVGTNGSLTHAPYSADGSTFSLLQQTEIYYGVAYDSTGTAFKDSSGNDVIVRVLSKNQANWVTEDDVNGLPTAEAWQDPTSHAGWFFDLPISGERVTTNTIVRDGKAIMTSLILKGDRCAGGADSLVHEISAYTGARLETTTFDVNGDGVIDEKDLVRMQLPDGTYVMVPASAIKKSGRLQAPSIVKKDDNTEIKYFSSSDGSIQKVVEKSEKKGVHYWREH